MLARALVGEANCSFFYAAGSEFNEVFSGMGADRIRKLFRTARAHGPAVIFIDEIDALAGSRDSAITKSARSSINQLLAEMDGFKQSDRIIVIGATNMEDGLDSAIKRPGRFDKIVHIPLPDSKARTQIITHYIQNIKANRADIDVKILANKTTGLSGAELKNLVNLAILNAVKQKKARANMSDFEYALDRILMGIRRTTLVTNEKDKLRTAYHESGHVIMNLLTKSSMA